LPTISEARILQDSSKSLIKCLVINNMIQFINHISKSLINEKVKFYTSDIYNGNLEEIDIANTSHPEVLLLNKRYLIIGLDIIKNKSLVTLVICRDEEQFRFFLGDKSIDNQYNKKYYNYCKESNFDFDNLNKELISYDIKNKISIQDEEPWYFGNNFEDCPFEKFESRFNDFSNGLLSYYKFMQNFSKDFNE
jgi:hypothetical protein